MGKDLFKKIWSIKEDDKTDNVITVSKEYTEDQIIREVQYFNNKNNEWYIFEEQVEFDEDEQKWYVYGFNEDE